MTNHTNHHRERIQWLELQLKGLVSTATICSPRAILELIPTMEKYNEEYLRLTGHNYQPVYDQYLKRGEAR